MTKQSSTPIFQGLLLVALAFAACADDEIDPNLMGSESGGSSSLGTDATETMGDNSSSPTVEDGANPNDDSAESQSTFESSSDSSPTTTNEESTGVDPSQDEDSITASSTDSEENSSDDDESAGDESTDDSDKTIARNIELTMVEANQAVQVALAKDGEIVEPKDREVELIQGRRTFVRAHWDIPNNWRDREIDAVLALAFPDGSEKKLKQTKEIAKKSNPDRLDGSFTWMLEAEDVVPNLEYSVTLFEVDHSQDAQPEPATPPRFPREGLGSMGIVEGEMELKVVLIIARTESGTPDATPEQKKKVEDEIFENYPIQKLIAEWRVEEHDNFKGSRDGLKFLQRLREEDDADANAYYHLFVSNKDHKFGWSGVANMASATKQSASRRVGMTVARGSVDRGRSTVVHEIGHNHGLRHSPCGGAGGSNDDFPHPGARLGVPGLRILAKEVLTTEKYRDYMSYCRPRWPSDYYYQLNMKRVRTLTSWDHHGELDEPNDERSLVGTIDLDGKMYWKLIRGQIGTQHATRDSKNVARIWSEGVMVNELPIWRTQMEDSGLRQVIIAVGNRFDAEFVEVVIDGKNYHTPIEAIDIIAPPVRD